jgi:hypothetical protein
MAIHFRAVRIDGRSRRRGSGLAVRGARAPAQRSDQMLRAREATRWALVRLQDLHDPGGNVVGLHLSQRIFCWRAIRSVAQSRLRTN